MALTDERTTLICLFHHEGQARAAVEDLSRAGVAEESISVIDGDSRDGASGLMALERMGVPERDREHLQDGLRDGGSIVAVMAIRDHVDVVENIFGKHQAKKIDEAVTRDEEPAPALAAEPAERVIPVVEEELAVGKRTVDQGGVRVFRRVVEIPVEETVALREEHVLIERNPVDRPATDADLELQGERVIELTETAEEAVVGKDARVVEEVVVGKVAGERTEHISETVRRTQVEMEELPEAEAGRVERQRY